MTKPIRRGSNVALLAMGLFGLSLVAVLAAQPGAAAHLEVDGGVAQYWEFVVDTPEPQDELALCGDVAAYDEVIYGTEGDDELVAGNGRQVIVGLGGNDVIHGGNHDDCLIGGDGNDHLVGDNGRDLIFGGPGADLLDGGTGKDHLDGGSDGALCVSDGAPDEIVNCVVGSGVQAATTNTSDSENNEPPISITTENRVGTEGPPGDRTGDL